MSIAASDQSPELDWGVQLQLNSGWLRTVLQSRLADPHQVEDLLQEVAVAVLRASQRPTEPTQVAPWLYRVAIRRLLNHRRGMARSGRRVQRWGELRGGGALGLAAEPAPEQWLMRSEARAQVRQCLEALESRDRQLLLLKYQHGWSYQQLGRHLGVDSQTIERRLRRARRELRRNLVLRGAGGEDT
jgi:RNA polymerase sigma factor (sigma-70 family)